MITRAEYQSSPHRLHQPYYLSVAQEAGVQVPKWLMRQVEPKEGHWTALALKFKAPLTDALHQRGAPWDCIAGICAVKAMAQHQLEKTHETV